MRDVILQVENLTQTYNGVQVLQSVSFDVFEGEFFSVIGPSGSGKSTLLKTIAGVQLATKGHVLYKGKLLAPFSPESREVIMVWQSLALFPHMDVAGNVGFGLTVRGEEQNLKVRRVRDALAMVALDGYEKRRVNELSGGEQQRVALARAFVVRPKVLLLDEPLGSLDAHLRAELQAQIRVLHRETGITFMMVTHDQSEALALSNRIAVMNKGRLEQVGTPEEIMKQPRTAFVARFVGLKNVLEGLVEVVTDTTCSVRTPFGVFTAQRRNESPEQVLKGSRVAYIVEAADMVEGEQYDNTLRGNYFATAIRGSSQVVHLGLEDGKIVMFQLYGTGVPDFVDGSLISVSWPADKAYVLPL